MSDERKKFHFTKEVDLYLAREVVGQNPYEDQKRWNLIQINIMQITGKNILVRTLKERIRNLVSKFQKKELHLQNK